VKDSQYYALLANPHLPPKIALICKKAAVINTSQSYPFLSFIALDIALIGTVSGEKWVNVILSLSDNLSSRRDLGMINSFSGCLYWIFGRVV